MNVSRLNMEPINLQATRLLKKAGWMPHLKTQLSSAALMRWAVESGKVEIPPNNDAAMGMLMNLEQKNPQKLIDLLTKTDSGDEIEVQLSDDPTEAAAQLWNDLLTAL